MDFLIVGAGAVGSVIGASLERAGHGVAYFARPGQPRPGRGVSLQRVGHARVQSQPPRWVGPPARAPRFDWAVVCVRAEQLTAALERLAQYAGPQCPVLIATISLQGALPLVHGAGLRGPVLALQVGFGALSTGEAGQHVEWFAFRVPSVVSAEGQRALRPQARALAKALARAGIPTRAALDLRGWTRVMIVGSCALLPAWELCRWDLSRLARDRGLRAQTAAALRECVSAFAPERGAARVLARSLPRWLYGVGLALAPRLASERAQALWRVHGPKIRAQTQCVLQALLGQAEREGVPLPQLSAVRARSAAQCKV